MTRRIRPSAGFTLVEMIIVIVITGIIAGMVAVFITSPVQGYVDSVRRAELTDAADVALRRIARDVRLALPNSLRPATNGFEFIMTKSGGRYRDDADGSSGAGLKYLFSDSSSFDVVGPIPLMQTGDFIVVYNLGEGYAPADAYTTLNNNVAIVGSGTLTANPIPLSTNPFPTQSPPLPSPNARFQVVGVSDKVVRYICGADGVLMRHSGCDFDNTANCTATAARLAGSVDGKPKAECEIDYTSAVNGRNGLLYIKLKLTDTPSDESVELFQQIHVDNSP